MFDKNEYSIGEWPIITVQDSSKNIQVDLAESITITILSYSYSDGKQLELTETGQNTGIFTSTIQLSSSPGI